MQSSILSKLPVYDVKQLNREHYDLLRVRAMIFRDFFKELHAKAHNENATFRVVFSNNGADPSFEFKKIVLVSGARSGKYTLDLRNVNKDYVDPYVKSSRSSDKPGEYTLNLRNVSDVNNYASSVFNNVHVATSISCSPNVYDIVNPFAEKFFPNLKVRRLSV